MKKILSFISLMLAIVFLGACSTNTSTTSSSSSETNISSMPTIEGITYYGDIPENPKKVVNFAYSYTGYLLQLGVNVSSYSLDLEKDSPAFGDKLSKASQLTTSDTEAIAAEEPDLIIVFAGSDDLESLKQIAPVIEVTFGKRNYLEMMTDLGHIFGKEKEAQAWLDQWETKVAAAKKELSPIVSEGTTFTVLDFFDKSIYTYGREFGRGSELIFQALGYDAPEKIVSDVFEKDGWLGISQETLPDYIGDYAIVNVNDNAKEAAASLKESDIWKNLPAVKAGHAIDVDYNLFYIADPMSLDLQVDAFVKAIKAANP